MKKVVVVGGGLSGLSAARAILDEAEKKSLALELVVLEKKSTLGGKIASTRENGFLCETGPNGFLDSKPSTLRLVKRLGLMDEMIPSSDEARKRFILLMGKLRQVPENPVKFLKSDLLSLPGKLRIFLEAAVPKGNGKTDESVASFVTRRLGREAYEKLIDPMSAGIYAGDPVKLSLKSCFPRIMELEQEYGGLIRGMLGLRKKAKAEGGEGPQSAGPGGVLMSFNEGMGALISALGQSLGQDVVKADDAAQSLERKDGRWRVLTSSGERLDADAVILAAPAYATADILKGVNQRLADDLDAIPYAPASVVCVGFKRSDVSHLLDGFGFLVPTIERRRILGSLWSSSIFSRRAPDDSVLLTQIVGGARNPNLAGLADDELLRLVLEELSSLLGLAAGPEYIKITKWPKAIPQYNIGHAARIEKIAAGIAELDGLLLGGNAYYGIGVNDCTARAEILGAETIRMMTANS